MKKKPTKGRPGRPAKDPAERIRAAKMCGSTFGPEVVAWLESLGDGSRNTGLKQLVEREFAKWKREQPPDPPPVA